MDEETSPSTREKDRLSRVTTACDNCRKKKVRCDGPFMPDKRCSTCVASSANCTYLRVAKKRGPAKRYTTTLETRLSKLENLLRTYYPDIDVSKALDESTKPTQERMCGELSMMPGPTEAKTISPELHRIEDDSDSSDYESAMIDISNNFHDPGFYRSTFIGKSSGVGLCRQVMDMKNESSGSGSSGTLKEADSRRPEFWEPDSLLMPKIYNPEPNYWYPKPELLSQLVDSYFTNVNIYLPIFHRPTFEQAILDGLHLRDEGFGAILLLVCAVGSKQSKDPALNSGMEGSQMLPWLHQLEMNHRNFPGQVKLFDVQLIFVAALYTWISCPPGCAWLLIGVGVRLCQAVGAHRQKTYGPKPTVIGELWKRVFWAHLIFEYWISCSFGRQCSLRDEDFDADYPAECDDEYWLHPDPEKAFKQPPGKPCTISYFVSVSKQSVILGRLLRTLYSSRKSKTFFGILGFEKELIIAAELDSALNKWVDSVPTHLRWDPGREDSVFARQSAHLWANYYYLQILIHRPFLTHPRKSSTSDLPSVAICTNAARRCSGVIEMLHVRYGGATGQSAGPIFSSTIVLLFNIWGSMRAGQATDYEADTAALTILMNALGDMERIFLPAAPMRHMLASLATVGKVPDSLPPFIIGKVSDVLREEDEFGVSDESKKCVEGQTNRRQFSELKSDGCGGMRTDEQLPSLGTWQYPAQGSSSSTFLGKLVEPIQEGHPFAMTNDPNMSAPLDFPALVQPWTQPLVASDRTVHGEMMLNFNHVFSLRSQAGYSAAESGLASMAGSGAPQSHSVMNPAIGMAIDLPWMSTAGAVGPPSTSEPTVWEDWEGWDTYAYHRMNEASGVQSAMHVGQL